MAFAKRFSDEYKEIKDTGEKAVQWFTAKSEEQRVQLAVGYFVKHVSPFADAIHRGCTKHTTLCEMWNSSRVINRSREIEDARKRRCTAWVDFQLHHPLPLNNSTLTALLKSLLS